MSAAGGPQNSKTAEAAEVSEFESDESALVLLHTALATRKISNLIEVIGSGSVPFGAFNYRVNGLTPIQVAIEANFEMACAVLTNSDPLLKTAVPAPGTSQYAVLTSSEQIQRRAYHPVLFAIALRRYSIFKMLMAHPFVAACVKANARASTDPSGNHILHVAAQSGAAECFDWLFGLQLVPKSLLAVPNEAGQFPMDVAQSDELKQRLIADTATALPAVTTATTQALARARSIDRKSAPTAGAAGTGSGGSGGAAASVGGGSGGTAPTPLQRAPSNASAIKVVLTVCLPTARV